MRGLRTSWAVREVSRPPCSLVGIPRKLSSAGERDNTFSKDVSLITASLMGKTGYKAPIEDNIEFGGFGVFGRCSGDICGPRE